jgi:hypothetical protein
MAKAIPVTATPDEVKEATTVAPKASDPRIPDAAPEYTATQPKTVTKLDNGTTIEDY